MIENLTKGELQVLAYFISDPGAEVHIRGLSEETGSPYSTVRDSLEKLEEEGYLESEEKGNMRFYSTTGEEFREIKRILNLEKLAESGLVEKLERELRPEAIILFGSYLEGRDKKGSDIDIAVIAGREKEVDLGEFEAKLGREIQIITVENPGKESKEFQNTLANGYVLKGYLELV